MSIGAGENLAQMASQAFGDDTLESNMSYTSLEATFVGKRIQEIQLTTIKAITETGAEIELIVVSSITCANDDGSQRAKVPFVVPAFSGPATDALLKGSRTWTRKKAEEALSLE
jgi:hypothetical protein